MGEWLAPNWLELIDQNPSMRKKVQAYHAAATMTAARIRAVHSYIAAPTARRVLASASPVSVKLRASYTEKIGSIPLAPHMPAYSLGLFRVELRVD